MGEDVRSMLNENQYRKLVERYYNLGHEVELRYRNRTNTEWMLGTFTGNWDEIDYRLINIIRKETKVGPESYYYTLSITSSWPPSSAQPQS